MRRAVSIMAGLVLAACTNGTLTDVSAPAELKVQLDVFSGRVNPEWRLSAVETEGVRKRLRDLPRTDSQAGQEPLGYRGFLLLDPGQPVGAGSLRIRVVNERIVVIEGEHATWYRDVHGLEQYLKQLARARGYADIVPA